MKPRTRRSQCALTSVLALLAAMLAACSAAGTVASTRPPRAQAIASYPVGCNLPAGQVTSGDLAGNTVVLHDISVTTHIPEAPVAVRNGPWRYWMKWGLFIRAGSPTVVITVPTAWQHRAAITWGLNVGIVEMLRLPDCPAASGTWNAYAGGFFLRSSSACVPLVFRVGQQSMTIRFGVGRLCIRAGSPRS